MRKFFPFQTRINFFNSKILRKAEDYDFYAIVIERKLGLLNINIVFL